MTRDSSQWSGAPDTSVRDWWAENPMTYGSLHGDAHYEDGAVELGSEAFFAKVDRRFFDWNRPLHGARPFDRLFPFDAVPAGSNVLEIGCGMGTMAECWARHGARVTAVDLNPTSVAQTRARFALRRLEADVREADARRLPFEDGAFDYVYSWGVLHHSPDLEQSVAELFRVLRPGGGFGVMLYHRRSFLMLYQIDYLEGFLHRERAFLSRLALASRYTDGDRDEGNPHTWPVTRAEARACFGAHSADVSIRTLGTDLDGVFRLLLPGVGGHLPRWMLKPWARRFGWSLWIHGRKAGMPGES